MSHVKIIDWKSGFTERGAAEHHLQIRTYLAGVMASDPKIKTGEIWLVELDKRYISKSPVFHRDEFLPKTLGEIAGVIIAATTSTPADYKENSSCRYCAKATSCPALDASLKSIVVQDLQAVEAPEKAAELMPPEAAGRFLSKWKAKVETAVALVKAVEQRAFAIIKAGGEVPGWVVGTGRNMRAWADENAAGAELQGMYGDSVYALSLKTPAQIEKEFKGSKDLVKSLVETKAAEKLVPSEGA